MLSPGFCGEPLADDGWAMPESGVAIAGLGAAVGRTLLRGFGVAVGRGVGTAVVALGVAVAGNAPTCDVWPSDDTICG
jgi:hypothetical protein